MADEIKVTDIQQGRNMAWHGKTVLKPDLSLDNCEMGKRDVQPFNLYRKIGDKYELVNTHDTDDKGVAVPFVQLYSKDIDQTVGEPFNPASYRPPTIEAFLEMLKKATGSIKGATLESIGTLKNRAIVFASFAIPEVKKFNVGKRVFEGYLNFGFGYVKSQVFYCNTSQICTVCFNTHTMNELYNSPGIQIRVKMTKNFHFEIQNVAQVIENTIGLQAEYKLCLEHLAAQTAKEVEAFDFFTGFIAGDKPKVISTRAENTAKQLTKLFAHGPGNEGKNRLDVYSAITDFYSHESSGGDNRMKQHESSEIGSGARNKDTALKLLLSPARDKKSGQLNWTETGWKDAIRIGQESIKLTERVNTAKEKAIEQAMAGLN